MASGLNLVPDPIVVSVQAGFFLTHIYVMKKWVVEPYLKLKEKRRGQTSELLVQVQQIEAETQKISATVEQRTKEAMHRAEQVRLSEREKAEKEQAKLIAAARQTAEARLRQLRGDLAQELEGEFRKLTQTAKQLASEVVAKVRSAT